jgi:hypothetical protein
MFNSSRNACPQKRGIDKRLNDLKEHGRKRFIRLHGG